MKHNSVIIGKIDTNNELADDLTKFNGTERIFKYKMDRIYNFDHVDNIQCFKDKDMIVGTGNNAKIKIFYHKQIPEHIDKNFNFTIFK